jgi:hypothetical protein
MTASITLVLAIGVAAFFGVRLIMDTWFVEAEEGGIFPPFDEITNEEQQPRFNGEMLGIFIAPSVDSPPDGYTKPSDVCPPGEGSQSVPWEEAGLLDLDLILPADYVLETDSPNTSAIACGGTVTTARRNYTVRTSNGMTADVIIGRSIFRLQQYDVAEERVTTETFGGLDAVLIRPVTADGLAQRSGVAFPEPFGSTFITATSLPLEDLLDVAALVGEATAQ